MDVAPFALVAVAVFGWLVFGGNSKPRDGECSRCGQSVAGLFCGTCGGRRRKPGDKED